jgi:hypothetical protein
MLSEIILALVKSRCKEAEDIGLSAPPRLAKRLVLGCAEKDPCYVLNSSTGKRPEEVVVLARLASRRISD